VDKGQEVYNPQVIFPLALILGQTGGRQPMAVSNLLSQGDRTLNAPQWGTRINGNILEIHKPRNTDVP
jgi:hypothetical protein